MKRATIGMFAVAILAMATVAFAQKPDFSGSWTIDAEASGMAAGGRGPAGPMVVKQTADTLTTETTRGENKVTMTYKLDGTESVNKQTMGQMGEIEIKSVAKWDGTKLVINDTRPGRDGAIQETVQTWSLEGGVLTIERTGGRGPSKQVYKKTS